MATDTNNSMLNYVGSRFVLEPGNAGRLLWLENSDGGGTASLSRVVGELFVVHFDCNNLRTARVAPAEQGFGNVTFTQVSAHDHGLPFPDEHFDGVVIAGGIPACRVPVAPGAPTLGSSLHSLIAELYRVLRSGGYVYVHLRNNYSYQAVADLFRRVGNRDGDRGSDRAPSLGLRQLAGVMCDSGFAGIETYKLLGSQGVVEEVILSDQYSSAKNSFTFKQKVKGRLLSSPLACVFVSSMGIVATKGRARPRYLDVLVSELIKVGVLSNRGDRRWLVKRYLILPGKVILSIGEANKPYGERIVVLPLNAAVLDRLRNEALTLEALNDADLRVQSVIPKFFAEGELGGQQYFVQQEMPGTSIDAPVASLEEMTSRAVRLLIEFQRETAQDVILDDKYFGMLFSSPMSRLVEVLGPGIAAAIDRIEKVARSVLHGKQFTIAWMHGDYKIENLIFDPDSMQISGVIDWDLSLRIGYPLLDLLYLIAYNRVIREGRDVEEIILDCIIPQKYSEFEQAIRDEYVRALGIREDHVEMLTMMFCLHHLGYRRDVAGCSGKTIENMLLILGAAEKLMESKYGRGSLQ